MITQFHTQRSKIGLSDQSLPYPYEYSTVINPFTDNMKFFSNSLLSNTPNSESVLHKEYLEQYKNEDYIEFYTDGSKTEKGNFSGLAIYSLTLVIEEKYKISKSASIFITEASGHT